MTQQEHFIQNVRPLLEKADGGEKLTEEEEQMIIEYCMMRERQNNSQN